MDRTSSANLGNEVVSFLGKMPNPPVRSPESARAPIFYATYLYVPDDAVAAVIARDDGAPMVAALEGQGLYLVSVEPNEQSPDEPKSKIRLIRVEPTLGSVEVVGSFQGANSEPIRNTTWTFTLADGSTTLEIPTMVNPEDSIPNPQEDLAQALARALGWSPSQTRE